MAMTEAVKDELGRLSITKPCCRKAEVSALLRFAGGLHIAAGKIIIEVELDTAQSARRLRKDIAEVFGHESELSVVSSSGIRKGSRYIVRVLADGDALARQTGLVDANNRPIRGLPPQVVSAAICDSEAAWRGAFLAHAPRRLPRPRGSGPPPFAPYWPPARSSACHRSAPAASCRCTRRSSPLRR